MKQWLGWKIYKHCEFYYIIIGYRSEKKEINILLNYRDMSHNHIVEIHEDAFMYCTKIRDM